MKLPGWNVCILFVLSAHCFAVGEFNVVGARSAGMAFSSVAISDEWSAFNNPAGLSRARYYQAGIYFENHFLVKEMSLKAVTVTIPVWKGAFGIVLQHNGFSLYSEIKGGVTYGMSLGKYFSAGVQLSCIRINQSEGYGNKNIFSFDLGAQYQAGEHLTLGAHIVNPSSTTVSKDKSERLPALIRIGILWKISNELLTTLEAEKDLTHKPVIRAGIEYHLVKPLYARAGIITNPTTFTMGTGLAYGSFRLELASSYHLVLGYSPQASISYRFK